MTIRKILASAIAFSSALIPRMSMAQSSDFDRAFQERGAEARLSLRIPFGQGENTTKTAPRLELGVRHYTDPNAALTDWMLTGQPDFQEARLSLTLESTPQFMLNDQILIFNQDEDANIGTAGKIGLGVAAVVVTGVATLAVIVATTDFSGE